MDIVKYPGAMLMSIGMFARIAMLSEWGYLVTWLTGAVFLPTLALILGGFSGSRRLFEAIFIVLMYFGPINSIWKFDFMGITGDNSALYAAVTVILFGIGMTTQILK